ncbi:replication protein A 70 kDa DNA-binding subunit C-like [Cryptomeria japonica]|uniref:replication protein A 70 kDa DNA-binding subunit C-like n=1 Tax=Cryptomeria japonica TaxID=3369 RepID=UPI0025ACB172|nr:replication protein A 70 kDa DNA-binding subunit C-like [Cryptomeria japonica]
MADTHYGNTYIGAMYKISGGVVKTTNKFYNKLNSEIEITLVPKSIVTPCEDDPSIPKNHFSFMPINEILEQSNNSNINVIGVVICVELSSTIRRRNGIEVIRHTIKLLDMSRTTIEVTIWGAPSKKEGVQLQQKYYLQETTILAIKSGRVCEYNGKINGKECKKRLIRNGELDWYCSKCEMTLAKCAYRYIVHIQLEDHTDTLWAIAFDEGETQLLGMLAETLYKLQFDTDIESNTDEVIKSMLNKQYIFRLTYKKKKYNEEERLKITITKVEQVDFVAKSNTLLEQIKAMNDEMGAEE